MIVTVKIGTSSLTDDAGHIQSAAIEKLANEVAALRAADHQVLVVTSGAIAAGLPALGLSGKRPRDAQTLQAISAVGQTSLMGHYAVALGRHDLVMGQVLLAPTDFFERRQYLHARGTLQRLLELGVVPVVNENDAVADDAIRFGDNDRIAALVAQLVGADRLVLLTDQEGVFTTDPRHDDGAELVSEILEIDDAYLASIGGAGSERGSGGMTSKVAAAQMAAWAGVPTVIAAATSQDALARAISDKPDIGTFIHPKPRAVSARKMWIAHAVETVGDITVDDGAKQALTKKGTSLLSVGVVAVDGSFEPGDAVNVRDSSGVIFARGLVAVSSADAISMLGFRTDELPEALSREVVHRNALVLL